MAGHRHIYSDIFVLGGIGHQIAVYILEVASSEQRSISQAGENLSDYEVLLGRQLQLIMNKDKSMLEKFKDAKIVVGEKVLRDALNNRIVQGFADKTSQEMYYYHADDKFCNAPLKGALRKRMLRAQSNITDDVIGMLPLIPGMKLMITDNLAMQGGVANRCEGELLNVKYKNNEYAERRAVCAYI